MFEIEIKKLSDEIAASLPIVLNKASQILDREVDYLSLNGIIGGKNRTHAKVLERKFSCFEEYFECWLKAMYEDYLSRKDGDEPMDSAGFRNAMLLRDDDIMLFTEKYLKRAFLRKFEERTNGSTLSQEEIDSINAKIAALKLQFHNI